MLNFKYYTMTNEDWKFLKEMKPKDLKKELTFNVDGVHSPYGGNKPAGYLVCLNCVHQLAYFDKFEDAEKYANKLWKAI